MTVRPDRRARLAKVHIARDDLKMEEDSYRAMLRRITGHNSAKDCTDAQLDAVLGEFARLGFTGEKARRKPPSEKAYVRMIYGLWKELKPFVRDGSVRSLQAFVRRQTGLDAPEFLNPEDANDVIEGLKAWIARERAKAAAERKMRTREGMKRADVKGVLPPK